MKKIAVLYHSGCRDGFAGALAAYLKFKNKAEYIPVIHQEKIPAGLTDKEIYIIDFSYSAKVLKKLEKNNKKLVVIDHHKTAKANVMSINDGVFDNNHSGAVLAWKYFYPKKKIPKLYSYIEDHDIWKLKLPHTNALKAYLFTLPFDFTFWLKTIKQFENKTALKKIIGLGDAYLDYFNIMLQAQANEAELVNFDGHKIWVVNAPRFMRSNLGHILADKSKKFSVCWQYSNGKIHLSFRSVKNFDVSKIAKKYGGGGHKNAAGCEIKANINLPWKPIKK